MAKLTPLQLKHYDSLQWLLNPDNRGQGRTYLMAIVWLNMAHSKPGVWIEVYDHIPYSARATSNLVYVLKDILEADGNTRFFDIENRGGKAYVRYRGGS